MADEREEQIEALTRQLETVATTGRSIEFRSEHAALLLDLFDALAAAREHSEALERQNQELIGDAVKLDEMLVVMREREKVADDDRVGANALLKRVKAELIAAREVADALREELEREHQRLAVAREALEVSDRERDVLLDDLAAAREENGRLKEALDMLLPAAQNAVDGDNPFLRQQLNVLAGVIAQVRAALAREDGGKAAIDSQLRQMLSDEEFERFRETVDGPREDGDVQV